MISAKYASSLLENKITAISLAKIQKQEYTEDENGRMVCSMTGAELRHLLHANKGSFYSQLEPVAINMTSRSIGFSDPSRNGGEFEYISVIDKAKYKDGVFSVYFNPDLRYYISELEKNFTIFELPIMLNFKNGYSFRLYELLSSRAYSSKYEKNQTGTYKITFNLSELKLSMGVVNAELDAVRRELNTKKVPDYDKAVAQSPEKKFEKWYEFRRCVLNVATEEINEKSDIYVEFKPLQGGVGNKTYGVEFYVTRKNQRKEKQDQGQVDLTEDQKFQFHIQLNSLLQEYQVNLNDILAISQASGYNYDLVAEAKAQLDYAGDVKNPVGWLISCIKKGGYQTTPVKMAKKNSFHNFEQRKYSREQMDDLEKILLNQGRKS
ncbi:MAG: replication initiation protein [Eubacterium sp.]|nr:replication initiation protein [Eubacterium sp.]